MKGEKILEKNEKSIIIIGAGISGMSAGCYGQMNGYKTKIFESHFIPGGCCTAWERKGYVFDQCIDWLLGTKLGTDMNQVWRELGALKNKKLRFFNMFNRVVGRDGQSVTFYVDPNRLEAHLKEISPEDGELIEEFCNGIRAFSGDMNFPLLKPEPLYNENENIEIEEKFIKKYGKALRDSIGIEIVDFAKRFKNPFLQEAFPYILQQKMCDFPLMPYCYNLAAMSEKNAGYPEGGSLELAKSIERRYTELGGEIVYEAPVKKILVENDKAIGVMLEDGTKHYADIVLSAADGRTTIFDMLDGKYVDNTIKKLYEGLHSRENKIYEGFVLVFLGINRDLTNEPDSTTYFLEHPSKLLGCNQKGIVARHYCHHAPEFAPPGKSVMQFFYYSEYDCWKRLYDNDRAAYKEEKGKVADFIINYMEQHYPGLKDQIEAIDVSTPVTAVRYTGNHEGSVMAWIPFADTEEHVKPLVEKYHMKLPGLSNFYMAGHWVSLGGLVRSSSSGRHVIQFVCKDDKKSFVAQLAD
jgi:phytoene dehydrogenase-like protein